MGNQAEEYDLNEVLADALRHQMTRRGMSAKKLSRRTGIDDRTIEKHRTGENKPGIAHFMIYACVFGPEYVNDVLECIGITGAFRMGDGSPVNAHAAIASFTHAAHVIAQAKSHGSEGGEAITREEEMAINRAMAEVLHTSATVRQNGVH